MMPNEKRIMYYRRFLTASLCYAVVLPLSIWLQKIANLGSLEVLIALTPVLPVLWGVFAAMGLLESLDELQRQIQTSAMGFAALVTGLATFAYSFLEGIGWPRLDLVWVLPILISLWGIGIWLAGRRYRRK